MPGRMPFFCRSSTNDVPSAAFWRIVSSNRITPLMYLPRSFVVNSMSRYARRFSSTLSTLMLLKRFSIVPVLSSAARMPLPEATIACAVAMRSCCDAMTSLLRMTWGVTGSKPGPYSSAGGPGAATSAKRVPAGAASSVPVLADPYDFHRVGAAGLAVRLADREHDVITGLHRAALQKLVLRQLQRFLRVARTLELHR